MKLLSKKWGWIIHPLEGGLGTYKETWDKLNAELYTSNPYFDSNFIEPMLTYFTSERKDYVSTVKEMTSTAWLL